MPHLPLRRSTAIVAAIAAAGLFSAALAATPATAAKKVAHPAGFFTTDAGRATSSTLGSALARDDKDGEHVITVVASSTSGMGRLVYLTHPAAAKKWTSETIPGLRPTTGIRVEAHLSRDGRNISVVIYECDGVYTADTTVASVRLPEPTLVQSQDTCATATAASDEPPVALAIAEYSHYVDVLLPDPKQDNRQAYVVGRPAGSFTTESAIPTTDDVTVSQVAFDSSNSSSFAVGEGTSGTTKGIYVLKDRFVGAKWTGPVLIATLNSATSDYTVESVAAYRGQVWVGLERTFGTGAKATHKLYLVHGTPSGQWDGVIRLPHDTTQDTSLRLLINPVTRTLHAAFTLVDPASKAKKSGILQEAREHARWSAPKYFTHWYRDVAQQITINSKGKAVIGYEQQ